MCLIETLYEMHPHYEEDMGDIAGIINRLSLTVPQTGEHRRTAEGGAQSFLDHAGVVLRVIPKKEALSLPIRTDHILQPLTRTATSHFYVDIYPGVRHCGPADHVKDALNTILQSMTATHYKDVAAEVDKGNIGFLPYKTEAFPQGVPVLLDAAAARDVLPWTQRLKNRLQPISLSAPVHEALYGDLQRAFQAAWKSRRSDERRTLMRRAWKASHHAHVKGCLVSGWQEVDKTPDPVMTEIRSHGQAYSQKNLSLIPAC